MQDIVYYILCGEIVLTCFYFVMQLFSVYASPKSRLYFYFEHSFVVIDHEIFSTVIFSLPLIQDGQFLAKDCAQILVNR